jgi:type IX secretion system PorP/SprF family membrane protein
MKKTIGIIIGLTALCLSAFAQDPHFSQFFYSPLTINPANTGIFNGDIRASTLYRMQWFTITNPYKTASVAIDAPIFKSKMRGKDFFSAGINFINDNQGSINLTTNSYNGLLSYTKFLGGKKSHYITVGYEVGYNMKTAGLGSLKYDSQYDPNNGTYSTAYGVSESAGAVSTAFLDMSTGLVWNFNSDRKLRSSLGFSMQHFTAPNVSLYGGNDQLLRKYSFQWNIAYKLGYNSNAVLLPTLLVAKQGGTLLINTGTSIKYLLQERSRYTDFHGERSLSVGFFYRYADAAYMNFRLDYEDFAFALAYDINLSGLTPTSKSVGGIEFMLQYRGIFGFNKNSKRSSTKFM